MANYKKVDANALEGLDKVLDKVDPLTVSVMLLGGTAAYCGVVPPLTQVLRAFSDNSELGSILTEKGIAQGGEGAGPIKWVLDYITGSKDEDSYKNPSKYLQAGLFCSGAVEAAILITLVKNPAALTALGEALKGVGEIVPG